jgi:hypothetical protein
MDHCWALCMRLRKINLLRKRQTYRDRCCRRILTDFSALLTAGAGSPARAAGVHCLSVVTTSGNIAGRNLVSVAQLFSIAEIKSTFLQRSLSGIQRHHSFVYSLARVKDGDDSFQELLAFTLQFCGLYERVVRRAQRQVGIVFVLKL